MKNREKYADFLVDAMSVRGYSFGVDKETGEPKVCASFDIYTAHHVRCENCALYKTGASSCLESRKKWLNEEVDEWADFRDLKRGDIIMLSVSGMWYPVIFVRFDEFGLRYSRSIDNRGDFVCEVGFEEHPNHVKKCLRREYYEQ